MANLAPGTYADIREFPLMIPIVGMVTASYVVIEILMNVFFLNAGKEIKDAMTLRNGALRQGGIWFIVWITLGGVGAPMALFMWLAKVFDPQYATWRFAVVAAATDVVFAVVVGGLAFKNKLNPAEDHPVVKTLLAVAVLDDLLGVGLIIIFLSDLTSPLDLIPILASIAVSVGGPYAISKWRPKSKWFVYPICGIPSLFVFMIYHVPSAIAMMAIVIFMPGPSHDERDLGYEKKEEQERKDPLDRMERFFARGWLPGILFLFAFMASGVTFSAESFGPGTGIVMAAISLGKPIGICLMALLAVYAFRCMMPVGVGGTDVIGLGFIAGIGFTVALLVAELAHLPQPYHTGAIGTLLSGLFFTLLFKLCVNGYHLFFRRR